MYDAIITTVFTTIVVIIVAIDMRRACEVSSENASTIPNRRPPLKGMENETVERTHYNNNNTILSCNEQARGLDRKSSKIKNDLIPYGRRV